MTDEAIWDDLRQCAQESLPQLIRHEMAEYANEKLIGSINTSTDPKAADLSSVLHDAAARSFDRIKIAYESELSKDALQKIEEAARKRYEESLADGSWVSKVRGRGTL